jgi:hypothetical protein
MAEVPKTADNAVLLLAAAHKIGLGPGAVKSTSRGYVAPDEVMEEAGFDPATGEVKPKPRAEKKAPAKSAAKKSTSKE